MEGKGIVVEEYSQEVRALEKLAKESIEERVVRYANGIWVRTLDQRRGARSVAVFHVPAGVLFPRHSHAQTELIFVTEGHGYYMNRTTGVKKELKSTDCVRVPPQTDHLFEGVEDTYGIVVMVPHTEAFANGR